MQNRELKQDLIEKEIYQQYCSAHNEFYKQGLDVRKRSLYPFLTDSEYKACEQLRKAKSQQRKRIKEWLEYWFGVDGITILFGTQSFNDNALEKSFGARQKAIQRMLTQCEDYVSNVDYGKKNEREHYHFIAAVRTKDLKETEWKKNRKGRLYASAVPFSENFLSLGWQNWQKIDINDSKIAEKLAGYVAKLVNHSLKVQQSRLGYKRDSTYQKFKGDIAMLRNYAHRMGHVGAEAYKIGFRWKDDRSILKWLDDPLENDKPY